MSVKHPLPAGASAGHPHGRGGAVDEQPAEYWYFVTDLLIAMKLEFKLDLEKFFRYFLETGLDEGSSRIAARSISDASQQADIQAVSGQLCADLPISRGQTSIEAVISKIFRENGFSFSTPTSRGLIGRKMLILVKTELVSEEDKRILTASIVSSMVQSLCHW